MKRRTQMLVALAALVSLTAGAGNAMAATWFVDVNSPGPARDGASWATAFAAVQHGINAAAAGDEVWVARGVYYEHVVMKDGVSLYGGFAGTETGREQRNPGANVAAIDGSRSPGSVVTIEWCGPSTRLDGFTIRNGDAGGGIGGGIYTNGSSVIANNVITGNKAPNGAGGGIALAGHGTGSGSVVVNNTITGNSAMLGGGVLSVSDDASLITGNVVSKNTASGNSGGIHIWHARPTIASNVIAENKAGFYYAEGIGMHNGVAPLIVNNTISRSDRPFWGSYFYGIHLPGASLASTATIANNIVAFFDVGVQVELGSSATLANNDFYGNRANYVGTPPGAGERSEDPQFVDRLAGNFHLKPTSPCIDAGDDFFVRSEWADVDGEPRIRGVHVDIGADETGPLPPVAKAGADQTASVGQIVTLDGSGSYDPDGNYPLAFSWSFVSMPPGSAAVLSNAGTAAPRFTPDLPGNYTIGLVVVDATGAASRRDDVAVSTVNSPPVAEAGPDQAIVEIGTVVRLDGTGSYDVDGNPVSYAWSIVGVPDGSTAVLDNAASATPSFVADVHGDYVIDLVTSDGWVSSRPDSVKVTFRNVAPVADAGVNQSVLQGNTVVLDGSASFDPNLDPLIYSWGIVSRPAGSAAALDNAAAIWPTFVADVAGQYVASLVVSDGFATSAPASVTVMAITAQDAVRNRLRLLIDAINGLPEGVLKNANMRNALTNKLAAVLRMVDEALYANALDKLQNDIGAKTDGCAAAGAPDANDWIGTCDAQGAVYPLVVDVVNLLKTAF